MYLNYVNSNNTLFSNLKPWSADCHYVWLVLIFNRRYHQKLDPPQSITLHFIMLRNYDEDKLGNCCS